MNKRLIVLLVTGISALAQTRDLLAGLQVDAARMRANSDDYLRALIKHGGAPLGKPGMPAFESTLDDRQIDAVIAFVRGLSRGGAAGG